MFDAAFTPSRAALYELRATRTFTQWDADVPAWKGKGAPTREASISPATSTKRTPTRWPDAVVRGDSAEPLLDQQAGWGASASPAVVQRKAAGASSAGGPGPAAPTPSVDEVMAIERQIGRLLDGIRARLVLVGTASDLKLAYDARASQVAMLADGDAKTRSTWLPVLQFQHTQLAAIW